MNLEQIFSGLSIDDLDDIQRSKVLENLRGHLLSALGDRIAEIASDQDLNEFNNTFEADPATAIATLISKYPQVDEIIKEEADILVEQFNTIHGK